MAAAISIDRRLLMKGAAGLGVSAAAVSALAACNPGGSGTGDTGGVRDAGVTLPTYKKFAGVKADLPGDAAGVPDAFFTYPRPPVAEFTDKPCSGGKITGMYGGYNPPPTTPPTNRWWADLNNRLGATFDVQITPASDYPAKLAAAIAGDLLPDIVQLQNVNRLPDVLKAKFHDLTDFISGDKINDYPNLANLPTLTWKTCVYNKRIMAFPPQNIVGAGTWCVRKDVFTKLGTEFAPTSPDEVRTASMEVTDAKASRYAFASADHVLIGLGCTMWNSPNGWGEQGGKFTLMQETEEYKQALDWTAKMWKSGVIHPDAFGTINGPGLFQSANVALFSYGGVGWGGVLNAGIKGLDFGFYTAPTAAGGGVGAKRLGTGTYLLAGITKQKSDDRVREILRLIDYMSSPFGTKEYLGNVYGLEGRDFSWDDRLKAPIKNSLGGSEVTNEFTYIGCRPYVVFNPGHADVAKAFYSHQVKTIPVGRADPTAILYSETNDKLGANLVAKLDDVKSQVIQGRKTMADLDQAVADWRSAGGDKIRSEFEAAFAASQGG